MYKQTTGEQIEIHCIFKNLSCTIMLNSHEKNPVSCKELEIKKTKVAKTAKMKEDNNQKLSIMINKEK